MIDELVRNLPELVVEPVEIVREYIAFKLVLNGSRDESAQAPVADVLLDARRQLLLDAY